MCKKVVEEYECFTDEELVSRFLSGEYSDIQILIDRYMPLIFKTVSNYKNCGIEAEDLIQEGVIAIFSAVKTYVFEKSRFSTYVSHCVQRAILTQVKTAGAKKRIPNNLISPLDDIKTDVADISDPESIYISRESFLRLTESVLSSLSEMEYNVFCRFVAGDSYSKIAEDLGISVKSVDNSLKRIRTKLKK